MVSILDCQSKGEGSTPSKIANFKCGGYRLMVRHEIVALVMVGSIPPTHTKLMWAWLNGRASACQVEGCGFESHCSLHMWV